MTKKKNYTVHEHIVPVFYLKFFANPNNKLVHRYDKQHQDIHYRSPKRIAYRDDYYEIYRRNENGQKEYLCRNSVEDAFGVLECKFREAFYDIIKTRNVRCISDNEKTILCDYISTQFARTHRQHMIMKNILGIFLNGIDTLTDDNQKFLLQNVLFASRNNDLSSSISLRDMIYDWMMNNGNFIFLENTNKRYRFYTSDNPVLIFDESTDFTIDAIYIPFSPTFALWVMDKRFSVQFKTMSKQHINQEGVKFFNKLICKNADRYIIAQKFTNTDIKFLKSCGFDVKGNK